MTVYADMTAMWATITGLLSQSVHW